MADAGFKLSVEGEKEFRKAISDINAILKLNQAELQKVTAEYNASEKSMDDMKARQEELGSVIERQTAAVAQMEDELGRLTESYGENDKGVIKMRTELDKASAALASMTAQYKANAEEIERASAASQLYDSTLEDIDAQISAFAAEIKAMDAAMAEGADTMQLFGRRSEETEKQITDLKKQNELLSSSVEEHKKRLDLLNAEMEQAVKLYGSQSKEVAEYRVQIEQTSAEVNELTRKMDDNADAIEKAENGAIDLKDVFGQISDITGVQIPDGLTKMIGGLDAAAASTAGLAAGLGGVAVGVAKATGEAVNQAVEYGDNIRRLADTYGLTTDEVQELQYVSAALNVDFDSMIDTLKDLRQNMYDASQGNADMTNEFANLGVYIYKAKGELRDADDVLIDLIDAYGNVSNETERAARMQMLLGENSKSLNTLIYAGGEAFEYYRSKAHATGYVLNNEYIQAAERAAQKTRDLSMAASTVFRNFGAEFGESLRALLSGDFEKFLFGTGAASKGSLQAATNSWFDALLDKLSGNYATGTYNHPGGYALVGERGPEIVDLPAGSRVYPNGEYPEAGTVINYYVTIPASDIREFNDIVRIAQSKRVTERMK